MIGFEWVAVKGSAKIGAFMVKYIFKRLREKWFPFDGKKITIDFSTTPRIVMDWKENRCHYSEMITIKNGTYYNSLVVSLKFEVRISGVEIFSYIMPVAKLLEVEKDSQIWIDCSLTYFDAKRITNLWNLENATKKNYDTARILSYKIIASLLVDEKIHEIVEQKDISTTLLYTPMDGTLTQSERKI